MDQAAIRSRTGSSSSRETGSLSSAKLSARCGRKPRTTRSLMPRGKFILPGLIDAHCHISLHQGALPGMKYTSTAEFCTLWAAHAIGRVLRAGVTSIAVPGGKWFTDVTVREAVEGGLLEGPRMVVAGRAFSNYGGIFDPDPYPAYDGTPNDAAGVLCNTRDEFIRETRKQCKRGVDLIKIADSTWARCRRLPMTK